MPNSCRLPVSSLKDIWDLLLVGCVSLEADGGSWVQSNDRALEFLGYADQELEGSSLSAITSPADWLVEKKLMASILRGLDDGYTLSKQFITRDGRHRWARVRADKIDPPGGSPFLIYQIMPGELELRREGSAALPVNSRPVEIKAGSVGLGSLSLKFWKSHWKVILWVLFTLTGLTAQGYRAVESWRIGQEARINLLDTKIENNQRTLTVVNSNLEILIKSLEK